MEKLWHFIFYLPGLLSYVNFYVMEKLWSFSFIFGSGKVIRISISGKSHRKVMEFELHKFLRRQDMKVVATLG